MEEKLVEYRLRKRRLEKFNNLKEKFFKMVSINIGVGNGDKKDESLKVNIEVNLKKYLNS